MNQMSSPTEARPPTIRGLPEAAAVCREAARGNLELRILNIDPDSELSELLHSINHLLDMTDAFVRESVAALEHANAGKFYRRVLLPGMLGSFRHAAESINAAMADMETQTEALRVAEERRAALADDFRATTEHVHGLTQASAEVGEVSNLIADIAKQSGLLALNAAIESARAGQVGAGFGVVASEVKRLADSTATATQEIKTKIAAIQRASGTVGGSIAHIWKTVRGATGGPLPRPCSSPPASGTTTYEG